MFIQNQFPVLLSVDISETDNTYLIQADITGYRSENVKVTSSQDSLILEMATQQEPGQSFYCGELEPEYYRRIFPLGFHISNDDIDTKYSSGTLNIYVNKTANRKRAAKDSATEIA